MPAAPVEVEEPRASLTAQGYVSANTRVHPTVYAAIETYAETSGVSIHHTLRTVLTEAYNSGRFDLPAE